MEVNPTNDNPTPPIPAETPPAASSVPPASNKKFLLIAVAAVIVAIIVLISAFLLSSRDSSELSGKSSPANLTPSSSTKKQAAFSPKIQFNSYTSAKNAEVQQNIPTVSLYSLKTNFSESDAKAVGSILGLPTITSQQNGYAISNTTKKDSLGMMAFDKKSGSFQAQLFGTQKVPDAQPQQTPQQNALALLQSIGVADPSVECQITYQLLATPEITYVECHRNWQKLDLPLVDFAGVMNMSINDSISKTSPGFTYATTPLDPSIINVSNGGSGRARPNDFNTATVGIRTDGTLASIDSNLRWITNNQEVDKQNFISSDQAITLAANGKSQMSFSMPSASVNIKWSDIYPNNMAKADRVNIDEILLVYLERPQQQAQNTYEPYYLIRGTAFLNSGHAVKYVQAVAGQKLNYSDKELAVALSSSKIADGEKQIQLDALTPVFEEPPAPTIETPPPTIQSMCSTQDLANNPNDGGWSEEAGSQYPSSLDVAGYGQVRIRLHNAPNAFYVVGLNNGQPVDMGAVRDALSKHGIIIYPGGPGCYITSISPAIFLYSENASIISVKLGSNVVFTDPVASNLIWNNVVTHPNGDLNVNGKNFQYLYYEYDFNKVRFENKKDGYIVKRQETEQAVKKIASSLQLNKNETARLIADARQILPILSTNYVKISLADENEVNSKLPLTISPKPDILHKINLTFSNANVNDNVVKPTLKPLVRTGFTVVEVGVSIAR